MSREVTGEEEIPIGAVAVLTTDSPDVLSHVAVRARNESVLFATCHDDGPINELSSLAGQPIVVRTNAAGDVSSPPQTKLPSRGSRCSP